MNHRAGSRLTGLTILVAAWLATACRDVHAPGPDILPTLADLIVSNPHSGAGNGIPLRLSPPDGSLIYASLPPGTFPDGRSLVIANRRTGSRVSAVLVAGGFDPVGIEADIGDTLDISIALTADRTLDVIATVPARRPPVIVRTEPLPGKRDVPLNSIVRLVFSEPLDRATVNGGSIQLLLNGSPVTGNLAFEDAADLVVSFTPDQPLAAGTNYTIVANREIQDLSGDPLAQSLTFPFTTTQAGTQVTNVGIYLASSDGTNPVWLVRGNRPAWSPDGQRLAFDQGGTIHIINVDGSGETPLTPGVSPSWSPDGTAIAFADGTGISTILLDGTGLKQLISKHDIAATLMGIGKPAWSPDGTMIAFEHFGDGGDFLPHQAYVMNADGSGPRPVSSLSRCCYAESDPTWTADGTRLLFWSFGFGITFADLAGTIMPVYQDNSLFAYGANPAISSDGTILFNAYPDPSRWGQPDAASLYAFPLRELIRNAHDGAWSPDGTRIVFVRGTP